MDRQYRTSVDTSSDHFTFIAGGDSRTNMDKWAIVSSRMLNEGVDFYLFSGDNVANGDNVNDWESWYKHGKEFLENNLVYYTWGNHEYPGQITLGQFVLPGNEKWYMFEQGNTLFICLLSEESFDVQWEWLLKQLQDAEKEWIIVFFHRPFFTTGFHQGEMDTYLDTWWKAFDDFGVDIVINGHVHNYTRSKPVNLNVDVESPVEEYGSGPEQGRLQIVSGGCGAPLYEQSSAWFVERSRSVNHYCKFTVNGDTLHLDVLDIKGVPIDSLILIKSNMLSGDSL